MFEFTDLRGLNTSCSWKPPDVERATSHGSADVFRGLAALDQKRWEPPVDKHDGRFPKGSTLMSFQDESGCVSAHSETKTNLLRVRGLCQTWRFSAPVVNTFAIA